MAENVTKVYDVPSANSSRKEVQTYTAEHFRVVVVENEVNEDNLKVYKHDVY